MYPAEKALLRLKAENPTLRPTKGIRVKHSCGFINKAACKKFIMGYAQESRYHKFSRLDPAIYDELNGVLRKHMRAIVVRNPSFGKTLR